MAAVLAPTPSPRPTPGGRAPGRPQLRLIPGGRSPQALAATYRRRRVVALLVLVTVVVLVVELARALSGLAAAWSAPQPAPIDGPTVVVEADAGDTLWTLARQVHPTGDVRPVVEAMVADRGTADLEVGEPVAVPVDG
ncbi:hypothetical protein HC251_09745 [Iamia sp. SCSIO 61187]|uniref:hypothetical protein n=1 Tax=Iamia sp. SCSIO 61187 TaxID=2722752 RepID=UPI001C632429|nr:hypothetical protein [Iamia sp. SCSIO 61187]QYG92685.1 hypothetical protein HC251_09745 [Iamia sp. SCSIO 61187]